ncbi:anaerobic glycerol-3-phosphate dehydrogenase subunit C [Vibrio variabilis]|uniref:Anaerobic glycerol-3-phosphate dehydrogenase subunit C n=1 Tax=Vibrio variabilis TaxID=990271 RepID=A0ABQ0JMT7_9VIBR|nr:anaerobic glycerol-3-phosphate dehydrogenase subunit C [Vibrio variabilis]
MTAVRPAELIAVTNIGDEHPSPSFEKCIKCTVCTVYCPVAKANPEYPGPKQCGPDGERLRLKSPEFFDDVLSSALTANAAKQHARPGLGLVTLSLSLEESMGVSRLA